MAAALPPTVAVEFLDLVGYVIIDIRYRLLPDDYSFNNNPPIICHTYYLGSDLIIQVNLLHNCETDMVEAYVEVIAAPRVPLRFKIKYGFMPFRPLHSTSQIYDYTTAMRCSEPRPICRFAEILEFVIQMENEMRFAEYPVFVCSIVVSREEPKNVPKEYRIPTVNGTDCDFKLICEGKEIMVHRRMLMLASKFFRRYLSNANTANIQEIYIDNLEPRLRIEADTLMALLRFMYGHSITDHDLQTVTLLNASREYDMETLFHVCEGTMIRQLNIEMAPELYYIGRTERAVRLAFEAAKFILEHYDQLRLTFNWNAAIQAFPNVYRDIAPNPRRYFRAILYPGIRSRSTSDMYTRNGPSRSLRPPDDVLRRRLQREIDRANEAAGSRCSENTSMLSVDSLDNDFEPMPRKRSSPVVSRRRSESMLQRANSMDDSLPNRPKFSRALLKDKLMSNETKFEETFGPVADDSRRSSLSRSMSVPDRNENVSAAGDYQYDYNEENVSPMDCSDDSNLTSTRSESRTAYRMGRGNMSLYGDSSPSPTMPPLEPIPYRREYIPRPVWPLPSSSSESQADSDQRHYLPVLPIEPLPPSSEESRESLAFTYSHSGSDSVFERRRSPVVDMSVDESSSSRQDSSVSLSDIGISRLFIGSSSRQSSSSSLEVTISSFEATSSSFEATSSSVEATSSSFTATRSSFEATRSRFEPTTSSSFTATSSRSQGSNVSREDAGVSRRDPGFSPKAVKRIDFRLYAHPDARTLSDISSIPEDSSLSADPESSSSTKTRSRRERRMKKSADKTRKFLTSKPPLPYDLSSPDLSSGIIPRPTFIREFPTVPQQQFAKKFPQKKETPTPASSSSSSENKPATRKVTFGQTDYIPQPSQEEDDPEWDEGELDTSELGIYENYENWFESVKLHQVQDVFEKATGYSYRAEQTEAEEKSWDEKDEEELTAPLLQRIHASASGTRYRELPLGGGVIRKTSGRHRTPSIEQESRTASIDETEPFSSSESAGSTSVSLSSSENKKFKRTFTDRHTADVQNKSKEQPTIERGKSFVELRTVRRSATGSHQRNTPSLAGVFSIGSREETVQQRREEPVIELFREIEVKDDEKPKSQNEDEKPDETDSD